MILIIFIDILLKMSISDLATRFATSFIRQVKLITAEYISALPERDRKIEEKKIFDIFENTCRNINLTVNIEKNIKKKKSNIKISRNNPLKKKEHDTINAEFKKFKPVDSKGREIKPEIIINKDGTIVAVYRGWLNKDEADKRCKKFKKEIKFEIHKINTPQGKIPQPRQIYACGDAKVHNYSGLTLPLHEWIPEVKADADRIKKEFGFVADSCLLNEYKDGTQGIGKHRDKETNAKFHNAVYTVSLGGTRDLNLNHLVTKELRKVALKSGTLCVLLGDTEWVHSIPKRANADYRISETFRALGT